VIALSGDVAARESRDQPTGMIALSGMSQVRDWNVALNASPFSALAIGLKVCRLTLQASASGHGAEAALLKTFRRLSGSRAIVMVKNEFSFS
jgi:hypothetical protein